MGQPFLWAFVVQAVAPVGDGMLLAPQHVERETYSEVFTTAVQLEGGGYLHLELHVSNIGPGDDHGACRLLVALPGRETWTREMIIDRHQWQYSAGPPESLRMGACGIVASSPMQIFAPLGDRAVSLRVEGTLRRMWPPGARVVMGDGDDDFFEHAVLMTSGTARAELVGFDGLAQMAVFDGTAHVDHFRVTALPHEVGRRWIRFRGLHADHSVVLAGRLPSGTDTAEGWMWTSEGRGFEALTGLSIGPITLKHGRPDCQIDATWSGGSLRIRTGKQLHRQAPVEALGVLGYAVRLFLGNPVTYRVDATLLTSDRGPVSGVLEMTYLDGN